MLFSQTVEEEVDVGCRCKLLVVPLALGALRFAEFRRKGQERSNDRATSSNYIVPVKLGQRRFREDVEVGLEVLRNWAVTAKRPALDHPSSSFHSVWRIVRTGYQRLLVIVVTSRR